MAAANVPEAPVFSRRVNDAEELAIAIVDAARAVQKPGSAITFSGVVRLEMAAGEPVLTIMKRN